MLAVGNVKSQIRIITQLLLVMNVATSTLLAPLADAF